MIKHIFTMVLLASITSPVFAGFKVETLSALQMETWRVRMGFHQLAVRGNAPEDLDSLETVIHEGSEILKLLEVEAVTTSEKEAHSELLALWDALGKRAVDNPLAAVGYADFNAFSEINSLTLDLINELQSNMKAATPGENDELIALGSKLLKISSEYIALSTFPSAGINTGTQEEAMAFSQEAMEFEMKLTALEKSGAGGDAAKRTLGTLKTRWAFIKGAIPQLDDPSAAKVPLLFYRYSSQTAEDLLAITQQ